MPSHDASRAAKTFYDVPRAAKELNLSKSYFYHLPDDTPGILHFGRAIRIDFEQFCEWAAHNQQSTDGQAGAEHNENP